MNGSFIGIAGLSCVFAFLEFCQHNDYHKKHPDYENCPTAILGFVILAIACIILTFVN